MGKRQWGVRAWLVECLAVLVAYSVTAQDAATNALQITSAARNNADSEASVNAAPCPPAATAEETLRCEMKRGSSITWAGHSPSSLHEEYLRLVRQARLPDETILDMGPKRAPFHPWAGKRSDSTPIDSSVLLLADNQPSNLEGEEKEEEKDWVRAIDETGQLSMLEDDVVPRLLSQVRVRRNTPERPHVQASYRQESRRPRFRPWGGKRSGVDPTPMAGRGRLEDILRAWVVDEGALVSGMVWPAAAVNPGLGVDPSFSIDTKRRAFSPWAGKRSEEDKRGGFSAWAGKRSEEDDKRGFSAWAGKRNDDEKRKFSAWAGKRSEDDDKRSFSAWAGKRNEGDDEKRGFSAWAGKRSDDEKRGFSAWAGKRNDEDKREAFSAWAGKRDAFSPWAGKRSNNDDKKRQSSAWAEQRDQFGPWKGKRR